MYKMFLPLIIGAFFISVAINYNEPIVAEGAKQTNAYIFEGEEDQILNVPTYVVDKHIIVDEWIYPISEEEVDLIAQLVMAEAEGEPEEGKRMVIDTVLNRVDHPHYPDNIHDVIYAPAQFSPMWNGRFERCSVKYDIKELVKDELLERYNYEVIYFNAGHYSEYGTPMFSIGNHYFSKRN